MSTPTAIQVASDLLSIHHHNDETNEIIYKEAELIPILEKWGIPHPDWEGNAIEYELFLQSMKAAYLDLHPGNLLAEYINKAKWNFSTAAKLIGISEKSLDRLLYKGGAFNKQLADRLEILFNKPATEWLKMQNEYLEKIQQVFDNKS